MDCKDARALIEADIDGELDLMRHRELAAHRQTCPACQAHFAAAQARRQAICDQLPRHRAPAELRGKILLQLPAAETPRAPRQASAGRGWPMVVLGAAAALALLSSYELGQRTARREAVFAELVADHVRSLQAQHLTDVVSTDQHTVKPWFAGKLDFSPPVTDLAASGFPLIGGRLEYLNGQSAAALVYRHRLHVINLMVWRASAGEVPGLAEDRFGYRTVSWSLAGLNFSAVSDLPLTELEDFAAAFRHATQ